MNVVALLLIAFAGVALYPLLKRRMESNVPLLFYCALVMYMTATGREPNTFLFLGGLFAALMLRFEFLSVALMNFFWGVEIIALLGFATRFFKEIFEFGR